MNSDAVLDAARVSIGARDQFLHALAAELEQQASLDPVSSTGRSARCNSQFRDAPNLSVRKIVIFRRRYRSPDQATYR
jgi:hypothetical protein